MPRTMVMMPRNGTEKLKRLQQATKTITNKLHKTTNNYKKKLRKHQIFFKSYKEIQTTTKTQQQLAKPKEKQQNGAETSKTCGKATTTQQLLAKPKEKQQQLSNN